MSPLLCICAPKTCYARIGSKPNKHKHNHTQQRDIRDSPNSDTPQGQRICIGYEGLQSLYTHNTTSQLPLCSSIYFLIQKQGSRVSTL